MNQSKHPGTFLMNVAVLVLLISFSQTAAMARSGIGVPSSLEDKANSYTEKSPEQLTILEGRHKLLLERGNETDAKKVKDEMDKLIPAERRSATQPDQSGVASTARDQENTETDWAKVNPSVHDGYLRYHNGYHKIIDMKAGEDGNLYLAAIRQQSGFTSGIAAYKSTNRGLSWSYVYGVNYSSSYVGNLSLLVESRANNVRDSTRLIIFHNLSTSQFLDNASINFISVRANGTSVKSGTIAYPSSGNEFSNICAVSDGAFYQNATYFGVVFMESTNNLQSKVSMRYFRTADWGNTWINATIQTNYNDFYPSVDFKDGTSDSIYIAVERRFDSTNSQIRIIATPFTPSASYFTYFVTSTVAKHEKPCITIKQNNPVDSMLMTYTTNKKAIAQISVSAGASWSLDFALGGYYGDNCSFIHCSSSPAGDEPFTVVWQSASGDSVNQSTASLGQIGASKKLRINSNQSFSNAAPVSAVVTAPNGNFGAVAYAGSMSGITPYNVYANQEGIRKLEVKMIIQGLYNPLTDQLRRADTVTAICRMPVSPHTAYDTARAVINPSDFTCTFLFTRTKQGSVYIDIRHRNSVQTWTTSNPFITFGSLDSNYFNFTLSNSSAYGYNQTKVNNSPARYAIFSGDVNQDGSVDASDVSTIDNDASNFVSGYAPTDLTGDEFVDAADFAIADNNAGKYVTASTP